jgi:hypothetical protein
VPDHIVTPRLSPKEKLVNEVRGFSPQVKQGLIAATVALLLALGSCATIYSENSRLKAKVHDLELEVLPFRNLAVQQFNRADPETLKKLADSMATLHKDYLQALASINELQTRLQSLSVKTAPRSLTPEQNRVLSDTLRKLGSHNIRIIVPGTDAESQQFAIALRAVFLDCGWQVPPLGGVLFDGPPIIGIQVRAGQNPAPAHLWAIHDVLQRLGFPTTASLDRTLKGTDQVEIIVGGKP